MRVVPKNFKCCFCDRETYGYYDECKECGLQNVVVPIDRTDTEINLRKKIHDEIDIMSADSIRVLSKTLGIKGL